MSVREMNSKMWTKDNVKQLLTLWESKSVNELSTMLNLTPEQVQYMASNLRSKGFNITKKHRVGQLKALLDDVASELGITLNK